MKLNFFVGACAVHHDFRGAKFLAAVQQVDFAGKFGKKIRLFHGRIAAADHGNFLAAEEISVARRARGNAVPDQFALGLQARSCAPSRPKR